MESDCTGTQGGVWSLTLLVHRPGGVLPDYSSAVSLDQLLPVWLSAAMMSTAVSYLDIPLLDGAGNPEVTSPVVLVDGFVPPWLSWDCPNGDCVQVEDTTLDLLHLVSVSVVLEGDV